MKGNYGHAGLDPVINSQYCNTEKDQFDKNKLRNAKKIIVLANGNIQDINDTFNTIRDLNDNEPRIDLMVQKRRISLMNDLPITEFIEFDSFKDSNLRHFFRFMKILFGRYDLCISTSDKYTLPYAHGCTDHVIYNPNKKAFMISDKNVLNVWKIFITFSMGEVLGLLLSPLFMIKNLYARNN